MPRVEVHVEQQCLTYIYHQFTSEFIGKSSVQAHKKERKKEKKLGEKKNILIMPIGGCWLYSFGLPSKY